MFLTLEYAGWTGLAVLAVTFGFLGIFYKFAAETWGWGVVGAFARATNETRLVLPICLVALPAIFGFWAGVGLLVAGSAVGALVILIFRQLAQAVWLLIPLGLCADLANGLSHRFDGTLLVASTVDLLAR